MCQVVSIVSKLGGIREAVRAHGLMLARVRATPTPLGADFTYNTYNERLL